MSEHRPWTYVELVNLVGPDIGKVCHSISRETVGGITTEYVGEGATEQDAKLIIRAVNSINANEELLEAAKCCLQDLGVYVLGRGPGPSRRLRRLRDSIDEATGKAKNARIS